MTRLLCVNITTLNYCFVLCKGTVSVARAGKSFQDLVTEAKADIQEIDVPTLKDWLTERRPLVILDVREAMEFQNGSIPKSVSMPRGILEIDIDTVVPDQNQPILVYCGGGSRSALAAKTLQIMGYEHVFSLAGGFREWQASMSPHHNG
jgi:sulfur-carrier protein adenylyltransferase/sulfurtransferase